MTSALRDFRLQRRLGLKEGRWKGGGHTFLLGERRLAILSVGFKEKLPLRPFVQQCACVCVEAGKNLSVDTRARQTRGLLLHSLPLFLPDMGLDKAAFAVSCRVKLLPR